jgi:Lysine methyltransferase
MTDAALAGRKTSFFTEFPVTGLLREVLGSDSFLVRCNQEAGVGTAGQVWPAAQLAARYFAEPLLAQLDVSADVAQSKQPLSGLRILELGTGTGALGVVCALLGELPPPRFLFSGCTLYLTVHPPARRRRGLDRPAILLGHGENYCSTLV